MHLQPSGYTVAKYCQELVENSIVINREYQRTDRAWPPRAKAYLIDTILNGFPMPKLSLYQKTDLKSRKTIHEIVDGQQRSMAILDFYQDKLRLSGEGEYSGSTYSALPPDMQQKFLSYNLTVDIFVAATGEEIREVFRRINSYTIPLNPQERRHAQFQGEFKWFIVDLCQRYDQILEDTGVLSEKAISRMRDGELLSEIVGSMMHGIYSASDSRITSFYKENDERFEFRKEGKRRFADLIEVFTQLTSIHNTGLCRSYLFYSIALALSHLTMPCEPLQQLCEIRRGRRIVVPRATEGLLELLAALESDTPPTKYRAFVGACSGATNRLEQRQVRFKTICDAIAGE